MKSASTRPTQSIPIILLTARADEETKLGALSAGASDFLTKPFSTTELHVRIKNLVESHQYQRKVSKQNQVLESTIEQLKETETQLVQTEKLASLGRMSAGIIHEINNPLNFATTGLFTLAQQGQVPRPRTTGGICRRSLKDVEEGIKRVKTIVSDLRMFTHPEAESRDQVEVAEVVAAALRFLSNEWKDQVRIERTAGRASDRLGQQEQAHPCAGQPAAELARCLEEQSRSWTSSRRSGSKAAWKRARASCSSGTTVRASKRSIWTRSSIRSSPPRTSAKGMGLGLAICYRIVQECEGRISVRTEPGKFCEFTLEFPAKG